MPCTATVLPFSWRVIFTMPLAAAAPGSVMVIAWPCAFENRDWRKAAVILTAGLGASGVAATIGMDGAVATVRPEGAAPGWSGETAAWDAGWGANRSGAA